MIKNLIKILLVFFLISTTVHAETVKDISISGNKRISNETIFALGQINPKDDFDEKKLDLILKKLYDTNFFSDVSLVITNNILEIDIIENPIIENIQISGIKNQRLEEDIINSLNLQNRMSFTDTLLTKDIETIKKFHKSAGFYFVKVISSVSKNEELNSIRINLDVIQGDRAKIKEIFFIGDKKIKDKKLLEIIASEEHKFWKFVSQKVFLNEDIVNLDTRLLENYYKNEGYYEVEVLNSFAELNDQGSFKLVFNIDAGEKFFFNNLKLTLPEDYNEDDFKDIEKTFKKLKGKNYSLDRVDKILKEIDKIASLKLYDFIDASVEEQIADKNKLNLNFKMQDSKKYYVERINIFGNFQTLEEVIRNNLLVDEGDPLNNVLYTKSIDKIRSTGFFDNVKSEVIDGSDPNLKIINITVEEQPTGEITMGAGYGSSGSTIGAGIVEKNFLGKGINLNTNFELNEESLKGIFIFSKPNFNYSENTLRTSFKAITTDNLDDFGYKESETGFSLGTTFQQYENLFFSPELAVSLTDLETNSSASANLKKQEGGYGDFYFNYGLSYDLRDSSFNPKSGYKTNFFQTIPIVSDRSEISNTFVTTKYKTLNSSSGMVGKMSLYLKGVHSITDEDVRVSKRAHVPYSRLRGFEKRKVGPIDNNDFIGGNYVSTLNFSTTLPGLFTTIENVDFSYFVDIANVWGVDYNDSIDDSNSIRSSTGLALDLKTPVGPLTFSFTQPITKKSTDKTESFRFNLGTTF
tara:strand:+ start:60 stop:2309 length:2250 start_codon:yes stop_codon:yes gene_type:complete